MLDSVFGWFSQIRPSAVDERPLVALILCCQIFGQVGMLVALGATRSVNFVLTVQLP